jgi:GT2 family glycosyltransferase
MNTAQVKKISVVICTFNRAAYLKIILQQLFSQKNIPDVQLQIVVVVDGSTDTTYEMLASEFPTVTVVKGPGNWWWTKSLNEGIKVALSGFKPDDVLILNDDSLIDDDYVSKLIESSKLAGDKAIIASISVTDTRPYKVSFSGVKKINWVSLKKQNYFSVFELLENIPNSGLFPTYALNGRGTFAKASVFQDLDLLDEHAFPQYGSDDDFALRAWKKGYKVLVSNSCIVYDRTNDTSKGTAFRQDGIGVFIKSFFTWNSVNYIPKQLKFYYRHGIKLMLPIYLLKFLMGTGYAYFFKYRKMKIE